MKGLISGLICFGAVLAVITFHACHTEPLLPNGYVPPALGGGGSEEPCPPGVVSFQEEVLPILVSNCAQSGCHDAQSREEGYVLDSYENVMRKGVKPGNAKDSKIYKSITDYGDDDFMPPPPAEPLNSEEVALIRDWINQGALNTTCGAPCNPDAASFAADVYPTLQRSCIGCHNNTRQDGNVNLEGYANVQAYALNGKLLGTIRHEPGFAPMPPSGNPLNDCRIQQITNWINDGAPNN